MFTIDVPLDQAREALTLARAQLTIRAVQLSQCRVCGADLERFEQALSTVREIITQLELADGIRPRKEQLEPTGHSGPESAGRGEQSHPTD